MIGEQIPLNFDGPNYESMSDEQLISAYEQLFTFKPYRPDSTLMLDRKDIITALKNPEQEKSRLHEEALRINRENIDDTYRRKR